MSSAKAGAYYKARSKQWLSRQGYEVFDMELQRVVYTPMGIVPSKRDQLHADIGFLTATRVVFVQVKGGASPRSTFVAAAMKGFAEHKFPPRATRLELHVWRRLARAPEVIVISHRSLVGRRVVRRRAHAPT